MNNRLVLSSHILFQGCEYRQIETHVRAKYSGSSIVIDSFLEDHMLGANHYRMIDSRFSVNPNSDEEDVVTIGFFSIHNRHNLVMFEVFPWYAHLAQDLFERAKKYEQVAYAFVPTGDELFLSLCLDQFSRLEKQAYFSNYTDKPIAIKPQGQLNLLAIDHESMCPILKLAGDFFDEGSARAIAMGAKHFKVYAITQDADLHRFSQAMLGIVKGPISESIGDIERNTAVEKGLLGFGVIEYGRIDSTIASIGMYVCPEKRLMGYAAYILDTLKTKVSDQGFTPRSGCWYYNHNSKKSMEAAGAYSKSRLLKIHF